LILTSRSSSRALGLLSVLFITKFYGLEELGILAIFQAQVYITSVLFKFGFPQSIYQLKSNKSEIIYLNLSLFQFWSIFFGLVALTILLLTSLISVEVDEIYLYVFALAFMISWISVESNLRLPDRNPMTALALEDILPGFVFFISLIVCYLYSASFDIRYIYFFSFLVSFVIVLIFRSRDSKILIRTKNFYEILNIIRKNFYFFLLNLSQQGHSHGIILILSFIADKSEIGSFRLALTILALFAIISSSIATEVQRLSSISQKIEDLQVILLKYSRLNFGIALCVFSTLLIGHIFFKDLLLLGVDDLTLNFCIILFLLNFIKSFFGFPDSFLIAKEFEKKISHIFIINTSLIYALSIAYLIGSGNSLYVLVGLLSAIQLVSIFRYRQLTWEKFGLKADIFNFKSR